MKKYRLLLLVLPLFQILFLNCAGTTGSSALPQATIETADNSDGISISSPSSEGIVIISGIENTVQNAEISTVIVQVSTSTSASLLPNNFLLQNIIPSAYAQSECSINSTPLSSIPECPELNSSGYCQYTPNSDGSFTLSVEADENSSFSISYINTTSCEETTLSEEVSASSNNYSLPIDAINWAYSDIHHFMYIFGDTNEDGYNMVSFDTTTYDVSFEYTEYSVNISDAATPRKIEIMDDRVDEAYMTVQTDINTTIIKLQSDGTLSPDFRKTVTDENHNVLTNLIFHDDNDRTYSSGDDTCLSTSLINAETETQNRTDFYYIQAFYSKGAFVYLINGLSEENTDIYSSDQSQIIAQTYKPSLPSSIDTNNAKNISYPYITTSNGDLILLAKIEYNSGIIDYYLFHLGSSATYCDTDANGDYILSLASNYIHLTSTTSTEDIFLIDDLEYSNYFQDVIDSDYLALLNKDDSFVKIIDLGNFAVDSSIDLKGTDLESQMDHIKAIKLLHPNQTLEDDFEIMIIKDDALGSSFIVENNNTSSLAPETALYTTNPLLVTDTTDDNSSRQSLMILEEGNSNDNRSNLLFYDLNEL